MFSASDIVIKIFDKETNKFTVAGNREYKKRNSTNSVQSSLKSYSLWVPLYIDLIKGEIYIK